MSSNTEKPRCNGQWTEARYRSFIISTLRRASNRWAPKNTTKSKARVERGIYLCASCKEHVPNSIKVEGKRVNNVFVDHIDPVIDPEKGFVSWDNFIERMFCEENNLQVLCKDCHDKKTAEERSIAKERNK